MSDADNDAERERQRIVAEEIVNRFRQDLISHKVSNNDFCNQEHQKIVLSHWNYHVQIAVFSDLISEVDRLRQANYDFSREIEVLKISNENISNKSKSTDKLNKKLEEYQEKITNLENNLNLIKRSQDNNKDLKSKIRELEKQIEDKEKIAADKRFKRVEFIKNLNLIVDEVSKNLNLNFEKDNNLESDDFESFIFETIQNKLVQLYKKTKI